MRGAVTPARGCDRRGECPTAGARRCVLASRRPAALERDGVGKQAMAEAGSDLDGSVATATSDADDATLLARFRDHGDREAMGQLYLRHIDIACRVAARYLGHGDEIDDAVQTAFMQCFRRAHQQRGDSVRGWIIATVVNACRMRIREDSRRRRREDEVANAAAIASEDRGGDDAHELARVVGRAVDALPERFRLPVWLLYREGLSCAEIATALSLPESTARSRVQRGFELLRQSLGQAGIAPAVVIAALLSAPSASAASAPLAAAIIRRSGVPRCNSSFIAAR